MNMFDLEGKRAIITGSTKDLIIIDLTADVIVAAIANNTVITIPASDRVPDIRIENQVGSVGPDDGCAIQMPITSATTVKSLRARVTVARRMEEVGMNLSLSLHEFPVRAGSAMASSDRWRAGVIEPFSRTRVSACSDMEPSPVRRGRWRCFRATPSLNGVYFHSVTGQTAY